MHPPIVDHDIRFEPVFEPFHGQAFISKFSINEARGSAGRPGTSLGRLTGGRQEGPYSPERKPLPAHLSRDEQIHAPIEEVCLSCGAELRHLGDDIAEQLELVPASFRVIRHIRPKMTCTCCDCIVQAPAPSRPVKRGMAGPGLLAACTGLEICRPLAVVSTVRDRCP